MKIKSVLFVAVLLAATGIVASLILSRPWVAFRTVKPLSVTGYAELPVTADHGVLEATLTYTNESRKTAYETCGQNLDRIRSLTLDCESGCTVTELSTNIEEVRKLNDQGKRMNQIDYYAVKRRLKIESANVEFIRALARQIYDLNADGLRIHVSGPRYYVSDLGALKLELVEAATQNAMERGQTIAQNADADLGKLVAARQGVIQITQPNSTDTSDWGIYDTQTIQKVAKITVKLEMEIRG